MLRLLLFLALCGLTACTGKTKERRAALGDRYVPDPNYIFFNNTRQRNYQVEDLGEKGNRFVHDDLLETEALLIPVIYDNWLEDEAYLDIQVRPTPTEDSRPATTSLLIGRPGDQRKLEMTARPDLGQLRSLGNDLATTRPIYLLVGPDTLDAVPEDARPLIRETITDYLRLVD